MGHAADLLFYCFGSCAMRHLMFSLMLFSGFVFAGEAVQAEEKLAKAPVQNVVSVGQVVTLDLIDAHREYQAAKLRMHEYRFVTLPQQRLLLDQQIKLTSAEIAVLNRRLRDYQPFLRVGDYSPVRTAAESHGLALIVAGQRLQQIKDGQRALLRLSRQQGQLYRLDVLRASTRMSLAKGALVQSLEK